MNITYNGKNPEYYGWMLATRPVITPSDASVDRYKIPGRQGELLGKYETRGNAKVTFKLHCKNAVSSIVQGKVVAEWLREAGHDLILSDESAYKMEVLRTKVNAYDNKDDTYKRVEVEMEVYPFKYKSSSSVDGTTIAASTTSTVAISSTDNCEPLYKAVASGTGSFQVNGNTMQILEAGTYYIDVRRKITYTQSGSPVVTASAENKVSGDYAGLVLKGGNNTITTSSGVQLTITKSREGFII